MVSRICRHIRTVRRLTQSEFADMIGCNRSTISRYERGEMLPSLESRELLAKASGGLYATIDIDKAVMRQKEAMI